LADSIIFGMQHEEETWCIQL